MQVPYKFS